MFKIQRNEARKAKKLKNYRKVVWESKEWSEKEKILKNQKRGEKKWGVVMIQEKCHFNENIMDRACYPQGRLNKMKTKIHV